MYMGKVSHTKGLLYLIHMTAPGKWWGKPAEGRIKTLLLDPGTYVQKNCLSQSRNNLLPLVSVINSLGQLRTRARKKVGTKILDKIPISSLINTPQSAAE